MSRCFIRKLEEGDLRWVALYMRPEDRAEIWSASRSTPMQALVDTVQVSRDTKVAVSGRVPMCIFGCAQTTPLSGWAAPWALGTPEVERNAAWFLKASKTVVAGWRQEYRVLRNFVHAENRLSVRWLRWLGFELDPAEPIGYDDALFHKFHMAA